MITTNIRAAFVRRALPILVATAILSTLGLRSARADQIKTISFSLIGTPNSGTVLVPQFDPAQGTLNSVSLSISGTMQFALEVFDSGPGAVAITAKDTLSFGVIPMPVEGAFTSTIPSNQPIYTFMPPAVSLGTLMENFGPNVVSFFTGTGTVPFQLSLPAASVVQFSGASTNSVLAFGGVSGTVTADYAFTPTSTVPEPACFGMAGLALVAVIARRKLERRRA